jgi:hypothetical protein
MSDLRDAARQALEALEHSVKLRDEDYDAIDALKAALEQPEEEQGTVALERERAVELTRAYQEGYAHGSHNAQTEQRELVYINRNGQKIWRVTPRREWRGLKDADYDLICDNHSTLQGAGRAIEAKLKELNHDV